MWIWERRERKRRATLYPSLVTGRPWASRALPAAGRNCPAVKTGTRARGFGRTSGLLASLGCSLLSTLYCVIALGDSRDPLCRSPRIGELPKGGFLGGFISEIRFVGNNEQPEPAPAPFVFSQSVHEPQSIWAQFWSIPVTSRLLQ